MQLPRSARTRLLTLLTPLLLAPLAATTAAGPATSDIEPDAVLLRFPDVSQDHIVFRYDGDLWLVDKQGGVSRRITTARGYESFARFSPDGESLAFIGGYDGGSDIYTLSIDAGTPQRVTHHPTQEVLCGWTPDGKELIYWSTEAAGNARAPRLMRVSASGGQPEPLPVPYGGFGTIDETGQWLAYTQNIREFRTWKRYQGGRAQDIWLFNLESHEARKITDHPGTDAMPMWHGREVVFVSDREDGRLNLYAFDVDSGETRRLTEFTDEDVRFPSIGPDDVVFQAGGRLYRYEFESGQTVAVVVRIPGERPDLRPRTHQVKDLMAGAHPGPSGVRVAVEARGDIFSVPVEEGVTRNLTRTDGVAERGGAWSPDGRWIAYFSDRTGEYQLTIRRSDGKTFDGADENGEKTLTSMGAGWKDSLRWAPDSEHIAFNTNDGGLHVYDFDKEELKRIATNPTGFPLEVDWSHDSGWLAWSHESSETRLEAVFLHQLETGETHEVTSGKFDDSNPRFDRNGDWLYFVSSRTFRPIYEDLGTTWIYTNTRNLVAVPLRDDVENPWAVEDETEEIEEDEEESEEDEDSEESEEGSDEDGDDDADGEDGDDEDGEEGDEEEEDRLEIDLEGFEARAMILPVDPGELGNLEGADGKIVYQRRPRTGSDGGDVSLCYYDMEEKEEKTILSSNGGGYWITAKGDKLLAFAGGSKVGVIDLKPDQKLESIDLDGMVSTIDPRNEWRQLLSDVHKIYRDFFYEEGMHGVDWDGLHARFTKALDAATSRRDIHDFIGEWISELNIGHAYNRPPRGGFESAGPGRPAGLLGCDWKLENGAYRIERILGSDYDLDARPPLAKHGVDAKVGDYLLAVNGHPVDTTHDVYAAFLGTVGRPTEITLNDAPTMDGNERLVLVEPVGGETSLRYRDWVARNRARVEELGGGRVGYVHVPDTGQNGQNELMRQFLGEMDKDALIVDERWNGGGQIPTRFIELLDRPLTNYWAVRHGEDWDWPPVGHRGPKCMLINGSAGSGGDAFPYYFRQAGLGKLIGRRTWGGLVGISGNPGLIDGATPTVPRFAFYELDGTWGVEGHGVEPDIEVVDDPALMVEGGDPQLEAAVRHMLQELGSWPFAQRRRPGGPDRSGSGITPEDR